MMTRKSLLSPSAAPWKPHAYQRKAVKFLLEHQAAALFLDPGLGKTSITLAAIKLLKEKGTLGGKVLLVAPLRVCHSVWPAEIEKWSDFSGLKAVVLHGPKKQELLETDADIYVINPEGLEWLLQVEKTKTRAGKTQVQVNLRRWKNLGFSLLVLDELSKFKHINTNRFKALKLVLGTFARRWGLTGSPAANGLMDLFGQCYMLDQGRAFGPYITKFRLEYFDQGHDGYTWTLKEGADKRIYERVAPLALRMAAEDYLEMPKLVLNDIKIELPPSVMNIYEQLEEDFFTKIDKNVVTAATAAVASVKCRQVANGGIFLDRDIAKLIKGVKSEREWAHLHDAKTDALEELVEELGGEPLLVAYDFEHDLDRIRKRFGDVPYIGGGVTPKRSKELEAAWNRGELPMLLGHPQSISHGLNLQERGYHVCWYAPTWNYELWDQYIRRLRRQGSKAKRIFSHHLIAQGTVDHAIMAAIHSKEAGQESFFSALKKYQRSRK